MLTTSDTLIDRCEAPVAPGWSLIAGGTALAAVLFAAGGSDAALRAMALAAMLLAWGLGLGMLLNRSLFIAQPVTRTYLYRSGRWPWQPRIAGSLDDDAEGLRLAPKPCGRRRACAAGYGLWIVLRRPAIEVLLGDWPDAAAAEAVAFARARRWGIPLRDGLGRNLDAGGRPDA